MKTNYTRHLLKSFNFYLICLFQNISLFEDILLYIFLYYFHPFQVYNQFVHGKYMYLEILFYVFIYAIYKN